MTKEEILLSYDEFYKYIGKPQIIPIDEIVFDIPENMSTTAKVNIVELIDGKVILHINPNINIFLPQHRKAILFHEFTHIYDFTLLKDTYPDTIGDVMCSYSEIHASMIEMKILLGITYRSVYDLSSNSKKIPYKNEWITVKDFITQKSTNAWQSINNFNPDPRIHPLLQVCYFFGYTKALVNGKKLVNGILSNDIIAFNKELQKLFNACWNNKIDQVVQIYKEIENNYALKYAKCFTQ